MSIDYNDVDALKNLPKEQKHLWIGISTVLTLAAIAYIVAFFIQDEIFTNFTLSTAIAIGCGMQVTFTTWFAFKPPWYVIEFNWDNYIIVTLIINTITAALFVLECVIFSVV